MFQCDACTIILQWNNWSEILITYLHLVKAVSNALLHLLKGWPIFSLHVFTMFPSHFNALPSTAATKNKHVSSLLCHKWKFNMETINFVFHFDTSFISQLCRYCSYSTCLYFPMAIQLKQPSFQSTYLSEHTFRINYQIYLVLDTHESLKEIWTWRIWIF